MTIDIPTFCERFGVDPAYVVATEHGIRLRDVPNEEADRIIVALLRSGLVTWHEDETLDLEEPDDDGITWVEDEADVITPGGPADQWSTRNRADRRRDAARQRTR